MPDIDGDKGAARVVLQARRSRCTGKGERNVWSIDPKKNMNFLVCAATPWILALASVSCVAQVFSRVS